MTEPVTCEQPAVPPNFSHPRRSCWAVSFTLSLLIMLLALGGASYWFGWPWAQQQWQRLDAIENQLATLSAESKRPLSNVPALAQSAVDSSVRSAIGLLETDWRRDLASWQAGQVAERAESARQISERMWRVIICHEKTEALMDAKTSTSLASDSLSQDRRVTCARRR